MSSVRPGLGEALVGHAAEQQRVVGEQLVELVLELVGAGELERPAALRRALGSAGILHDAVERQELGDDDLPHDGRSSWVRDGFMEDDERAPRVSTRIGLRS
jgi:hypothetical protein